MSVACDVFFNKVAQSQQQRSLFCTLLLQKRPDADVRICSHAVM